MNKIISFIREIYKEKESFIPLHAPIFSGNEKEYLMECIDSTFVSSVGSFVDKFEKEIAVISQTQKAVAVVNGTAALQVGLRITGVKPHTEVITQALTFVATANAISYLGASPIFLDVDLDTMGLSASAVESFLEENGELREDACYNKNTGKRISACVPMHTFGFPVHLDELTRVCSKWNIPIIEDAAESLGSFYKGRHTGSFGRVGTFSFNGNKIITSGGGGAIVSKDGALMTQAKHLTTTAKKEHAWEYEHDELGYNYRMPNINAALACAQLEQLNTYLKNKRQLAKDYNDFFKGQSIKFRTETPDTKANYWLMCVELRDKTERDAFLKATNTAGVMTRPIWQLMHRLPMFDSCMTDDLKNSLFLEKRIVNIPSSVRI
jgi:aminotransferase in exopolysaccharide biosynthesis